MNINEPKNVSAAVSNRAWVKAENVPTLPYNRIPKIQDYFLN
jgi:hypothetical protein